MPASMITVDGESPSNHLNFAIDKRENMRQTLEIIHSQSNSLLHLSLQWKDLEEYFDSISSAIAKREEEIELKLRQIDWKTKYMNKKSSDFEEKKIEFNEMLELYEERCEQLDDDFESLRCKFERLRDYKKGLKRKFKKRELKLEAKELLIDNKEHEVEFRAKKLNSIERDLLRRMFEIEGRERKIELNEKGFVDKSDELKLENGEIVEEIVEENDDYADIRFNIVMNGRDLQMFLNGRFDDHDKLRDEVTRGISLSIDPPKLVLDAIQGFYPEGFRNGDLGFDLNVVRRSCVLLLEQLNELKARIKACVRERAMRVAVEWKNKMNVGGDSDGGCLEVVGFLQLVATYGLVSEFDEEELLRLFEACARHDRAPQLCRSLGFTDRVHEIIQNLILREQPFEGIKLAYAFQLVDIFPPMPILRAHLKSTFHNAQKLYEDGDASVEVQIKCINMKLAVLDSVVKCIKEFGLASKYLVQNLEHQIFKLKVQKSKCNACPSDSEAKSTIENEETPVSWLDKETCLSTCVYPNIPVRLASPSLDAQTQSTRPKLASVVVTHTHSQLASC
ncbi:uncharacterized protein LOC141657528 [Silene latifolia]|uniref:uncharacterized protein LOC141657528 n=1 Tax=Silene latifolia TaxID=37657 RepID=UPI003D77F026